MQKTSLRPLLLAASAFALTAGLAALGQAQTITPADTQARQERPIPLGVSGGSQTLLLNKAFLYCYGGTLGAVVERNGIHYILSNNHVLAKENEAFAYGSADDNARITQPGNLDQNDGSCSLDNGTYKVDAVANLSGYVPLEFYKGKYSSTTPTNVADAAVAAAISGAVNINGTILGIGPLSGAYTGDVIVGLPVQKTGRTTAYTFGQIEAIHVDLDVSYDSGKARFLDQLRIRKACGDAGFSASGDSGSLIASIAAPTGDQPAAVGLLFAGGGSDTFANPIGHVLSELDATVGPSLGGPLDTYFEVLSVIATPDDRAVDRDEYDAYVNANCSGGGGTGSSGGGGRPGRKPKSAEGPLGLEIAAEIKARHSAEIFGMPEVVGHGVGVGADGDAVIEVYVAGGSKRAAGRYPADIEGVPVRVIDTGPIRAY